MKSHVNLNKIDKTEIFDFTFIGLGASNSLILLDLIKNGLLKEKNILIIESSTKSTNDKTYCFWSPKNDPIIQDLSPIISHNFECIKINNTSFQCIADLPYYYIRSIDLYNHTLEKLEIEKINVERTEVASVKEQNGIYSVATKEGAFQTYFIFDSRPPKIAALNEKDIYIDQSFYGLHIKCENDVFKEDAFEMMNFNIEQNGATQFLYVIPFSPSEALVELTRFGSEKIELNYASNLLKKHIQQEYGNYTILADEIGCIPMTTFESEPSSSQGVLKTGTAANLIKPSTGYGFKNMYSFAQQVSQSISNNNYNQFHTINLKRKKRFKFYDKLLLLILLYWPNQGKKIFSQLYAKQNATRIFTFLDEKTNLYQEIKIFASLPITPFLRAIYILFKRNRWLRYVLSLLLVLIYLLLFQFDSEIARIFSYISLAIGLISVGIPHGALDHLLIRSKQFSLVFFILKYSSVFILYYFLWQIFPLFSLSLFIIYSSFHFGESEIIEIQDNRSTFKSFLSSFLMGFSILSFIIGTHSTESITVISNLNLKVDFTLFNSDLYAFTLSIISFIYILSQHMFLKQNSYFGLLFLLILGTQIPLMPAFGLYFVIQHSENAWSHLKKGLKMNSVSLYKKSSVYTLSAMIIFILIALNAYKLNSIDQLWTQFFIFIACISLPHFIIMHLFYKSKIH